MGPIEPFAPEGIHSQSVGGQGSVFRQRSPAPDRGDCVPLVVDLNAVSLRRDIVVASRLFTAIASGAQSVPDVTPRGFSAFNTARKLTRPTSNPLVDRHVIRCGENLQILRTIIRANPVDVVDMFAASDRASDRAFSHKPMFKSLLSIRAQNDHIAVLVDVEMSPVVLALALPRTKARGFGACRDHPKLESTTSTRFLNASTAGLMMTGSGAVVSVTCSDTVLPYQKGIATLKTDSGNGTICRHWICPPKQDDEGATGPDSARSRGPLSLPELYQIGGCY